MQHDRSKLDHRVTTLRVGPVMTQKMEPRL